MYFIASVESKFNGRSSNGLKLSFVGTFSPSTILPGGPRYLLTVAEIG